jgi:hypothetical protein
MNIMKIATNKAPEKISRLVPFKCHGSMYATKKPSGLYVVYSYGEHFPIAVHHPSTGWVINGDKYSPTTSKHQSIARRGIPLERTISNTQSMIGWININN